MLCSPASHNTSLSFTLEESVHSRQEAAGGGVLPIRSMFAHACARVPALWPRACMGLAWVHQTGAPPHKPYACLQSCMLQAHSRVAAIYDQLRMRATGLTGSQFASVWLNPDSQGIVGGSACVPLQICKWSYPDRHVHTKCLEYPGILHLPLTCSLERATELVMMYIIERISK